MTDEPLTAAVPVEMLERLLYAAVATKKIEGLINGCKSDPLFPAAGKMAEAFTAADKAVRHARRAAVNYAGWNDPLTGDEIVTLLTLYEREGIWEITATERAGKPGYPNTLDGLMRRGMVELGVPCKGIKWGAEDCIQWIADPVRFAVRVTARGRSAAQLLGEQKGKS
jgi:hypothetical protein